MAVSNATTRTMATTARACPFRWARGPARLAGSIGRSAAMVAASRNVAIVSARRTTWGGSGRSASRRPCSSQDAPPQHHVVVLVLDVVAVHDVRNKGGGLAGAPDDDGHARPVRHGLLGHLYLCRADDGRDGRARR